jgi:spermidine/putrescine transport system ATP-binding protein
MQELLQIVDIYKDYEGQSLLRGIDLVIHQGEILCLLGPSGSGKSTLLRIIAGLETASKGQVLWQGKSIDQVPVHQRNFGLMFQDYALFPHLNVYSNVAFGLRMRRKPEDFISRRVRQVLDLVGLASLKNRQVADLSGGEQQRVALARALAPEPRLLMLDEPLGALDRMLKDELSHELRTLLHQLEIPAVYVTHDQQEAFNVADRLAILHQGRIQQQGTAEEILGCPRSLWLAEFMGLNNHLEGTVTTIKPLQVATSQGLFGCVPAAGEFEKGQKVVLVLKSDHSRIATGHLRKNVVTGKVMDEVFQTDGFHTQLEAGLPRPITFFSSHPHKNGSQLQIFFPPESVLCYAE